MITIKESKDSEFLTSLWAMPELYNQLVDDDCPLIKDMKIVIGLGKYFLVAYSDNTPIGIVYFSKRNNICVEGTVGFFKSGKGLATEAGLLAINWLKENTKYKKIITVMPEDRKQATKLIERLGFVYEGFSPKSFQRNGILLGQYYHGLLI